MNLGVFGLGIIGRVWAENLHRDGEVVRGWNRTPKKDLPFFTADARSAAAASDLLLLVVADPPAVQEVLDRIAPVLRAGQVVVQSSTISPEATLRFAGQVEKTGASFLEAPFMGSRPAAEQRQMVFYAGGDSSVLERARPVLARLSRAIEYIGPLGSASALKLAMNINIAMVAQALCESRALARAAGISDDRYFSALKLNVGHSGLAALKEPKLRSGDITPQFSVKHMAKDLRLAAETAGGLDLPQLKEVMKLYADALARGWAEDDFISLTRLLALRPSAARKEGA
ncbi:MAG: NAD(P)-dependent oxidoreductase [Verrucomicrobiae bacterium]|nr:NAD(P)-dependent oxidoreductase [Verrucomicrobiae bacterium]